MQAVGRVRLAKHNHEGAIKVGRTIDFELVGKGIAREFSSITLEEEYVQAELLRSLLLVRSTAI